MNIWVSITVLLALLCVAAVAGSRWSRRQRRRRHAALQQLLDDADHLEADLKACRRGLDRAHAVMAAAPGVPVLGEDNARKAIDAGLRSLLEHRLWIRDRSTQANQQELDQAVTALAGARARLEPQVRALDQAQHELEQAVRQRIESES